MIYLDYNATTPLLPAARDAMLEVMGPAHNPSSGHGAGRAARQKLDSARRVIADAVSAFPNEVIFCATGTEANALALHGVGATRHLVSAIEHRSVLASVPDAGVIPVDAEGVVKLDALEQMLAAIPAGEKTLVSIMLANNETGVIQPIAEVARMTRAAGAWLHVDAAQALAKIPVDMGMLGADMLTLCGHKLGGPVGASALIVRQKLPLRAIFPGGGQEMRRRAGTENLSAIVGFAAAVQHAPSLAPQRAWLDALEADLQTRFPALRIAAHNAKRLPNTSCIALPGLKNETQLMHLDISGICVSAGSACSSGRMEPSHVLLAMGWDEALASSAIRISTGWGSTQEELATFAEKWIALAGRLQPSAA
jgi:cysteine desulfurase